MFNIYLSQFPTKIRMYTQLYVCDVRVILENYVKMYRTTVKLYYHL